MDQLDHYRAAKLLISQYGEDAKAHAMRQVLRVRTAKDFVGEWAWMGVFDAVLELEANGPGSGQTVH